VITTSSTEGRVMIALADDPLEWDATWTCVEHGRSGLVSGWELRGGRQTETDTTDTTTATVYLNDRDGYFDPANTSSPFAGYIGKQIVLQVWNPVDETWYRQFRGHIDEPTFSFNPATMDGVSILSNVQLVCVGIMDWLANTEMDLTEVTGNRVFGNAPPAGSEGIIFYEDSSEGDGSGFDNRVIAILDDTGIPSDWYVVFTGNIDLLEGKYDPGDSPLLAIREALDAELPGIANGYEDRRGRFCAHGRGARLQPDVVAAGAGDTAWDFQRWKAGDGAAIALDSDRAQIRPPLSWSFPRNRIINVGFAYPADMAEVDKPGQFVIDSTSIATHQIRRTWRAEKLLTKAGTTTGNTGAEETRLYAEFWVTNRADPKLRVEALTLMSIPLGHPQASVTWEMLVRADISDVIDIDHGYPGGVGIAGDYFIEGREMTVRYLNPDMDMVTCTYNVSPESDYTDDMGLLGGT
jgi:hypothetical protein